MIRRIHLPLFLLALVIALVVKVVVHESIELIESSYKVPVRYNELPDAMIIDPLREVEVRLRGERNELSRLNQLNVDVVADLEEGELGYVEVTEDRLTVGGPAEFDVVSIDPNRFTLEIQRKESRFVPVQVVLTGEPSAGAIPGEPVVRPESLEVVGPRTRVRGLDALTAAISLNGHAFTFEEEATVSSPDPLVRVLEPRQVRVRIPMTVPSLETSLDEIPDEIPEDVPEEPSQR